MPRTSIDRFEQRKQTRAKLVDAALQLFSTSGYEHATVDDISQAAGYSKGAYYFHFSTKDDILLELLRMWTEDRTRALAASGDGLREAFSAFFSYRDEPRWPAVLLEFWAQATRNAEVGKRLSQAYASWRRALCERIETAAADGLRAESADDVAALVLAAHDGHAVQVAIGSPGGKAMTPEALADSLVAPLEAPVEDQARRTGTF
ncbi:MAG TPA: TetR/AcrR family transcriptional regulator [Dehalococcoidia bacterium]|nr:TetR/AcrR family transcriptional regulator [Dehalococcoidia bacterium]